MVPLFLYILHVLLFYSFVYLRHNVNSNMDSITSNFSYIKKINPLYFVKFFKKNKIIYIRPLIYLY